MGVPRFVPHTLKLIDGVEVVGVEVSTGNPHFVILVEKPDFAVGKRALDGTRRGDLRASRFSPADQRRVCARRERARDRDSHLRARRGPHTSSGTGSSAAATAALALRRCISPLKVVAPGGAQTVAWDGPGTELHLTGPAALIARGEAW
jgi:diaminopimelate epimerase